MNLLEIAKDLKASFKSYVDLRLKDLPAMMENLVADAVKNIPTPKDGEKGEPGPAPDMAEIGRIIKEAVAAIPPPEDGKPGEPGKSITIEDVNPVILQAVKAEVAAIPKPEVDMAEVERILAEKVLEIPVPKDGQPGRDGASVDMSEVERLIKEQVEKIPIPKNGEDGKSVTIEDVSPVILQAVKEEIAAIPKPEIDMSEIDKMLAEKVASIPAPKDGDDGKSVTIEEVAPLVDLAVKTAMEAIEKPKDGKDADPIDMAEVQKMIQKAVDEAVKGIQIPEPKNGIDGKDALEIEILPEIDEEKSYNRGTYATYKGGLWRSFERTKGMRGWENIVRGAADYRIEHDGGREFKIITELSSGETEEKAFSVPVLIYKGVYKPEHGYKKGDTVTYGGSLHYCNEDTTERPGTGAKSWTLAAKRGADGKDGKIKAEKKEPYKLHGGQ